MLSKLLDKITANPNEISSWSALLNFGKHILLQPPRTGKRHNLASVIRKRTSVDEHEASDDPPGDFTGFHKKRDPAAQLAAAIMAKVEDGNIKAAIRILSSEEKPAADTDATFAKLQERHPAAPANRSQPPNPSNMTAIQMNEAEVLKIIRSFPAGSSGGPDGVRPQHILDLVNCRECGTALLTSITGFVNTLLEGKCHPDVAPILFGGNLIALEKKSGGIRPIAIGYTWRRIAAKCANAYATCVLASYLSPIQVGVGVSGGCEAAVHASRRFAENMPTTQCIVKLDFVNAFNSLHRDAMLQAAHDNTPGIYKFCHLAYSQPSILAFGDRTIRSEEGPQQGDPLGAALFCETIQPMLSSLSSALEIGYMDDLTLGGDEQQVARDVKTVEAMGRDIGLKLNMKKCEFISTSGLSNEPIFSEFIHLVIQNASLLGAPLTVGQAMDSMLASRREDLTRAIGRLKLIAAHDALILLRASFSAPKLMHTLRSSPCAGHPELESFDKLLRGCVESITNSDLTELQWIQASLPVRNGGLGVRRVSSLAPSAFLASAAGTCDLQALILSKCQCPTDSHITSAMSVWTSRVGSASSAVRDSSKQHSWDQPCVEADIIALKSALTDSRDKARFLAVSAPHSGDWLNALPITTCGLRLDNESIRIAVGLRLGCKLCEPHKCPCGVQVDTLGSHGLSCRQSSGRSARHFQLNDCIWRALQRADIPSAKEPLGLIRTDGKHPDGLTLIPWKGGKSMTWDATVTDTVAESYLSTTAVEAGAAAEAAAGRKEAKYAQIINTHIFVPLAFETLGPINSKGATFLSELGRRISTCTGDPRETSFLFQRLSVTIQRFNRIAFEGSFIHTADSDS
jgi:Reverse transcriptase (RNA-dependent DNA polymerase)